MQNNYYHIILNFLIKKVNFSFFSKNRMIKELISTKFLYMKQPADVGQMVEGN
jgi:hypothetical protein